MGRLLALLAVASSLCACGLAETTTAAGTGAASQAHQAAEARQTEERVKQQIDASYQQAEQQRRAADAESH